MNRYDITRFARELKEYWHTSDPYLIAERFGISVAFQTSCVPDFTAQTVKMNGYPTMIFINADYDEPSRRILCAHELGHALLHNNGINHYTIASTHQLEKLESEANLFALTLLSDDIDQRINMPLERMSNYLLKSIIDFNLEKTV